MTTTAFSGSHCARCSIETKLVDSSVMYAYSLNIKLPDTLV